MALPLEDSYGDIIGKAMRGLGLLDLNIMQETHMKIEQVRAARSGAFEEADARKLSKPLRLNADALVEIGRGTYHPNITSIPTGLCQLTSNFGGDMQVNSYIVWDPATRQAALFDTGTNPDQILEKLKSENLKLENIFLTHTHGDHIDCLPQLQKATGAPTHVQTNGNIGQVQLFEWGQGFAIGNLKIETRRTTGHAEDGTTYVIHGLEQPVAVVGDAVFSGSMGGGAISYAQALETNLKNIYSLPDKTLLCPGHGPITSVALEKQHNPFYMP
ncbi:MAG: MBL fold metallo-hydrolase [Methylacidiphilales bacterium]|nr:MBL fold metallo-hydrolase [Candidatus Methylacidiphilales bacterium]